MAIDHKLPDRAVDWESDSPIDNEVPTYRALSPLAVVSVVFGCASLFTFTHLGFALLGVVAIAAGLLAQRRIRKLPHVLTGTKLANAGIGIALLFTLMAITNSGMQDWIYQHEAGKFAQAYVKAIKNGVFNDLIYLQASHSSREGKTPQQVVDEMNAGARHPDEFGMMNSGLMNLKKRADAADPAKVEFVRIESKTLDGIMLRATALLKISGGRSAKFPEEVQHALVTMEGNTLLPGYNWMVNGVKFPYEPKN